MWTNEVEEEMRREIEETRDYYENSGEGAYSYSADTAVDEIYDRYHDMYDEEDDYE